MNEITLGELIKYLFLGGAFLFFWFLLWIMRWDAQMERERQEECLRKMRDDASDDGTS